MEGLLAGPHGCYCGRYGHHTVRVRGGGGLEWTGRPLQRRSSDGPAMTNSLMDSQGRGGEGKVGHLCRPVLGHVETKPQPTLWPHCPNQLIKL